jgi:hypothetical protein
VSADDRAARRAGLGGVVAWLAWLMSLAAALLFVGRYASNVPSWDDWDMIPTLTRFQPVTWSWLWSEHNEHRVPLPRLVFLGLDRLFGIDMRVTMVADVLAMAGVAAALLLVIRRVRGSLQPSDAFLPLVLLSLGQAANLLWGWQLQFFASAALAGVAIAAIGLTGPVSPARTGIVVGVSALLLPLCGANGLGMAPALAAWPLALALLPTGWTGAPSCRRDPLLLGVGGGALIVTACYFIGWERVPYHPQSRSIVGSLATAAKFLTIGIGPASRELWPLSGLITLALLAATGARLLALWRERPTERARALGFLCALGGLTALALGLGLGRVGFEPRYTTLAAPFWCAIYLAWAVPPGPRARLVTAGLALIAVGLLWANTGFALSYGRELKGQLSGFERDLTAGVPLHRLLQRYGPWLHPHQELPMRYLPMLRQAGVEPYRRLQIDTTLAAVPVRLEPERVTGLTWDGGVARVEDSAHPALVFRLPARRRVEGIRLRYRYQGEHNRLPMIELRWAPAPGVAFDTSRFYRYSPTGDRANWERGSWDTSGDSATTLMVWVGDTVSDIEITPGWGLATFHLDELSVVEAR